MAENPRLQANGTCDFEGFTDIIFRLLNAAWGPDWGMFVEAYPNNTDPQNIKTPVISYKLVQMLPGQIGKDGTREIKPRLREIVVPPEDPSTAINIYGRIFDAVVEFEIWEESNSKASKTATKFIDFMDMYTGYIKQRGIKELIFQRFSNDTTDTLNENIVSRKIEYFVRFEHLNEIRSDVITKVTGVVTTASDSSINGSIPFTKG